MKRKCCLPCLTTRLQGPRSYVPQSAAWAAWRPVAAPAASVPPPRSSAFAHTGAADHDDGRPHVDAHRGAGHGAHPRRAAGQGARRPVQALRAVRGGRRGQGVAGKQRPRSHRRLRHPHTTPTIAAVAVSSFMLATAVSATAVATATASVFASASTAGKRGPRPQWRGGPGRRRFPRGLARAAGWKKNTGEAPTALAAPRGEGRPRPLLLCAPSTTTRRRCRRGRSAAAKNKTEERSSCVSSAGARPTCSRRSISARRSSCRCCLY